MKRSILIEVLLLLVLAATFSFFVYFIKLCANNFEAVDRVIASEDVIGELMQFGYKHLTYGIILLFASLADLSAMIIIALKDFPAFKRLLYKIRTTKKQRTEAKLEKSKADKQSK